MSEKPEPNWMDRGDGLPVFWDQFREQAMEGLRQWAREKRAIHSLDERISKVVREN